MATPVPTSERTGRLGRIVAGTRPALVMMMGVLAWAAAVGVAVVAYPAHVASLWGYWILQDEVFGFAVAFAVAGTIAGIAASATSGHRRWTITFAALSLLLIVASVAILYSWIFRFPVRNVGGAWRIQLWRRATAIMGEGIVLGMIPGLLMSGLVLAAAALERRLARWQFGLLVAVVGAVLGIGVLPVAMSHVSDLIVLQYDPKYRYLHQNSIAGAAAGAGTGSLAGAVVAGMIARWFAAAGQRNQRPTGQPVRQPGDGPVA
jgi:hypothetical protein